MSNYGAFSIEAWSIFTRLLDVKSNELFFLSCFWNCDRSSFYFGFWLIEILNFSIKFKEIGQCIKTVYMFIHSQRDEKFSSFLWRYMCPLRNFLLFVYGFTFYTLLAPTVADSSVQSISTLAAEEETIMRFLYLYYKKVDDHLRVLDRCVPAAIWLISCSHPHAFTIQSLFPPQCIFQSPTHRHHYHPLILLLLFLSHLISAGRGELRQDSRL